MQNVVTVHSEDVVDPATQAFSEESMFCLRVLTEVHALMHGPDDMCFCKELVCYTPVGFHCSSECVFPWAAVATEASGRPSSFFHSGRAASRSRCFVLFYVLPSGPSPYLCRERLSKHCNSGQHKPQYHNLPTLFYFSAQMVQMAAQSYPRKLPIFKKE